jgi:two-component system, NarL family, invasion response regulator UvrY
MNPPSDKLSEMHDDAAAVKVLVVDDDPSFRSAAREVVAATPGFVLAGEASSGEDALEMIGSTIHPDLVLMDVRMPGIGGAEATRRIRSEFPQMSVVVLSNLRDSDRRQMADALDCVVAGKEHLSSAFLRAVWAEWSKPN